LLNVLLKNIQRCPATTGGKVRRRPQDVLPITFLNIRAFESEQSTGNTFKAVDQTGHRVLRWVVDKQVDVFSLTVHFDKFSLKVLADLVEYDLEPLDSVTVKYLSSILGHEDQVDVE
jgi:hypothetical protein